MMARKDAFEKDVKPTSAIHAAEVEGPSASEAGNVEEFFDQSREQEVLRKVDICLMTLIGALYLLSFLGMSTDNAPIIM